MESQPPLPTSEGDKRRLEEGRRQRGISAIHFAVAIHCIPDGKTIGAWLHSLSDDGAVLITELLARLSGSVEINFADEFHMPGEILWTRSRRIGVRFNHRIDSRALLMRKQHKERLIRVKTNLPAAAISDSGIRAVRVTDISRRGMKLRHDGKPPDEGPVRIVFPWGETHSGTVQWSDGTNAGLSLNCEFDMDPFGGYCE